MSSSSSVDERSFVLSLSFLANCTAQYPTNGTSSSLVYMYLGAYALHYGSGMRQTDRLVIDYCTVDDKGYYCTRYLLKLCSFTSIWQLEG